MKTVMAITVALLLAACAEQPQEPARSYAGKKDSKAYSGDPFKGDKAEWEATLARRAQTQDEYIGFRAAGK